MQNLILELASIGKRELDIWLSHYSSLGRSYIAKNEAAERVMRHAILTLMPRELKNSKLENNLNTIGGLEMALNNIRKNMFIPGTSSDNLLSEILVSIIAPRMSMDDPTLIYEEIARLKQAFFKDELEEKDRDTIYVALAQKMPTLLSRFLQLSRLGQSVLKKDAVSSDFIMRVAKLFSLNPDKLAIMKENDINASVLTREDIKKVEEATLKWLTETLKNHYNKVIDQLDKLLKSPAELTSQLAANLRGHLLQDLEELIRGNRPINHVAYTEFCEIMDARLDKVLKEMEIGVAKKQFSDTLARLSGKDISSGPLFSFESDDDKNKFKFQSGLDFLERVRKDYQRCLSGQLSLISFLSIYSTK